MDAADSARARALLDRHPDKADKVGPGLLTFAVVQMGTSSSVHLVIVHPDGTVSRLRHSRPEVVRSERARLLDTLRDAVAPQVRGGRAALVASGRTTCALCGTPEQLTADHYPTPFAQIADDWHHAHPAAELDRTPLTLQTVRHVRSRGQLTDRALETDWIRYHRARARYRVLCRPCNSHTAATSHLPGSSDLVREANRRGGVGREDSRPTRGSLESDGRRGKDPRP